MGRYIVKQVKSHGLIWFNVYRVGSDDKATMVAQFPSEWKANQRANELARRELQGLA